MFLKKSDGYLHASTTIYQGKEGRNLVQFAIFGEY